MKMNYLKVGDRIKATLQTKGAQTYKGTITEINPLDCSTTAHEETITLKLDPGQGRSFLTVHLHWDSGKQTETYFTPLWEVKKLVPKKKIAA